MALTIENLLDWMGTREGWEKWESGEIRILGLLPGKPDYGCCPIIAYYHTHPDDVGEGYSYNPQMTNGLAFDAGEALGMVRGDIAVVMGTADGWIEYMDKREKMLMVAGLIK